MLGLEAAPTLCRDLADLSPLTSHWPQGLVHTPEWEEAQTSPVRDGAE